MLSDDERLWATLVHLSILLWWLIGPFQVLVTLVVWLLKKDESSFIDDHGREAMNFTISIFIYSTIAALLIVLLVGCVLLPAVAIFQLIVVIMAARSANGGQFYRYPLTIRLIS